MNPRTILFGSYLGAYLLSYFFRSANAVIAGDLRSEFGLDASHLGLMTSTFFAALALAQLPLGSALDRWGERFVVPALMVGAALGSLVFANATSFAGLTLGRTLLGLGFSAVLMGALKAFSAYLPEHRFATASSLLVGIGTCGALLAGTPLAWFAGQHGWRAVFLIGAGVVVASAAAIAIVPREASRRAPASALGGRGGSLWTVLRDHRVWRIAALNAFAVGTLLAVQGLWGAAYLADAQRLAPLRVGDLLVAMGVGVVIGNLFSGILADRVGRRRVVLTAGVGFTACHALLALIAPGASLAVLATLYLAFGTLGSFGVVLFAHARAIFPRHLTGRAITAVNLGGIAGAMLWQWLMGVVIEAGGNGGAGYDVKAYRPAFLLTTTLGCLALLLYAPISGDADHAAPASRPARAREPRSSAEGNGPS